mmetsp:Transcript_7155/g.11240  ORF Transcript_7155/g.11240 Transcript_7155/m.11240 type:complete len:319 (-) Transcript_7155:356-1312(-)
MHRMLHRDVRPGHDDVPVGLGGVVAAVGPGSDLSLGRPGVAHAVFRHCIPRHPGLVQRHHQVKAGAKKIGGKGRRQGPAGCGNVRGDDRGGSGRVVEHEHTLRFRHHVLLVARHLRRDAVPPVVLRHDPHVVRRLRVQRGTPGAKGNRAAQTVEGFLPSGEAVEAVVGSALRALGDVHAPDLRREVGEALGLLPDAARNGREHSRALVPGAEPPDIQRGGRGGPCEHYHIVRCARLVQGHHEIEAVASHCCDRAVLGPAPDEPGWRHVRGADVYLLQTLLQVGDLLHVLRSDVHIVVALRHKQLVPHESQGRGECHRD